MAIDAFRDGRHDVGRSQHAALDRGRPQISRHGVDLLAHESRGERLPGRNAERVLRGDGGNSAGAENAELMERLEVGLDPGGPAGVGARDGEGYPHE